MTVVLIPITVNLIVVGLFPPSLMVIPGLFTQCLLVKLLLHGNHCNSSDGQKMAYTWLRL